MNLTLKENLLDYLKLITVNCGGGHDYKFNGIYDLLLQTGRFFPLAPAIEQLAPMTKRQCYQNCFTTACGDIDFVYCEGMTVPGYTGFPVAHAWLLNRHGEVIDPTLDYDAQTVYFGIPFNLAFVTQNITKLDSYSLLWSDWRRDSVLLRNGFPEGAIHPLIDKGVHEANKA